MPLLTLLGAALALVPCRIEHSSRTGSWPAECGTLAVPENPKLPAGRQIRLYVARVPAINRRKRADPLFLLAGGPGMAATAMYAGVAAVFSRIGRERDIVIVDQRGTGQSNPLTCSEPDPDSSVIDAAHIESLTRSCLDSLRNKADVTQYTTSIAASDLERVRLALGYERINLYGVSYGTRVAQHYLRRYPQRVRSLILDGVIAPEQIVGPEMALDAEASLQAVLQRCAGDSMCSKHFGDSLAHYRAVRAQLSKAAVTLTINDPTTGEARTVSFGPQQLASVLRLQVYSAQTASLLPVALHAAATRQDYSALAGQFLLTTHNVEESVAVGMHNTVLCTEDMPFVSADRIDRRRLDATFIGSTLIDGLRAVCRVWPQGPLDRDFHAPLHSDVPVLLLSGGADPVTPPAYAAQAAKNYSQARHILIPGAGHAQLGQPCMDRVMADFLRDAAPAKLEVSCLDTLQPAPFFLTPNGPAP